jgi:hypothetical protein
VVDGVRRKSPLPVLTEEQRTGLNCRWWRYCHQYTAVGQAFKAAYAEHWLTSIQNAFVQNKGKRLPTNWTQLSKAVNRHKNALARQKNNTPETIFRYNISFELRVPEQALSPTTLEVHAASARWLEINRRPPGTIGREQSLAYFAFILACPEGVDKSFDSATIQQAMKDVPAYSEEEEFVRAVIVVAQVVGEILITDLPLLILRDK